MPSLELVPAVPVDKEMAVWARLRSPVARVTVGSFAAEAAVVADTCQAAPSVARKGWDTAADSPAAADNLAVADNLAADNLAAADSPEVADSPVVVEDIPAAVEAAAAEAGEGVAVALAA